MYLRHRLELQEQGNKSHVAESFNQIINYKARLFIGGLFVYIQFNFTNDLFIRIDNFVNGYRNIEAEHG